MKVLAVFGTRPEAIKMCPVVRELKKHSEIETVVCVTGQHKEMLNSVLTLFDVVPDYDLAIMQPNQSLSMIMSNVLLGMDKVLEKEKPDIILVHGDTSSAFGAALSAYYHGIPVGHVEAGLRTYDMRSPYPEEFNRQGIDLITDFYFAPTQKAKDNLLYEGKSDKRIFVTGNTVIDALQYTIRKEYSNSILDWAKDSRLIVVTAHRRENLGEPLSNICKAILAIVNKYSDVKVIYPVHKNPQVRDTVNSILGGNNRIKLIEPLDAVDFHNFMEKSYFIMTDSGGVQEEAPSMGKPVLVLRNTTERPEGVAAGTLRLVGTDKNSIFLNACELLNSKDAYNRMSNASNPYGDGHASERIVEIIQNIET